MRKTLSMCLLAAVAVFLPRPLAYAEGTAPLTVKSAKLTIDGTSTMHDYSLVTSSLKVMSAAVEAGTLLQPGALHALDLHIPVATFTSEKDGLKKKMLETIKAEKHPSITFTLASYTLEAPAPGRATALATGTLSVAGVDQPVELTLDLEETPGGLRVRGTRALSMKDFGIKPPTMFMGMLKTADKVTITFDLLLAPAVAAGN